MLVDRTCLGSYDTHITSSSVDSVGSIFAELFNYLKMYCVERGGWKIQDTFPGFNMFAFSLYVNLLS